MLVILSERGMSKGERRRGESIHPAIKLHLHERGSSRGYGCHIETVPSQSSVI
jgi:hypothetical protein